jgi:hypothetical protein
MLGLCGMHRSRLERRGSTDEPPRRGATAEQLAAVRPTQIARTPECHPDRQHMSKGLCKPCYVLKWQREHPETRRRWLARNRERMRVHTRKRVMAQYGLTPDHYEAMWLAQGGRCANRACTVTAPLIAENYRKGLHVDHDHVTGKVRGLLCQRCNHALGHVRDDRGRLLGLLAYLERS